MDYDYDNPYNTVSFWLAKILAGQSTIGDGVDAIQQLAADAVARLGRWEDRRISILLAGVFLEIGRAVGTRISNYEYGDTRVWPHNPTFSVEDESVVLFGGDYRYLTSGVHVKPEKKQQVVAQLAHIHRFGGINNVVNYMVKFQRWVAYWAKNKVGQDAMAVVIPAINAAPGMVMTGIEGTQITDDTTSFSYFAPITLRPRRLAPYGACNGVITGEFEGTGRTDREHIVGLRLWFPGDY